MGFHEDMVSNHFDSQLAGFERKLLNNSMKVKESSNMLLLIGATITSRTPTLMRSSLREKIHLGEEMTPTALL